MAALHLHAGIELQTIGPAKRSGHSQLGLNEPPITRRSDSLQRADLQSNNDDAGHEPASTDLHLHVQPAWNQPSINKLRLPLLFFDFLIFGMHDGSYGAILSSLESYYSLSYTVVSLVFLTHFIGYTIAALISSPVHVWGGQRSVAFLAPLCRLIPYVVLVAHPPYSVLVAFLSIAGIGNGLTDSAWNAYIAEMKSSDELLGFMLAFHGLGATISPLIITTMLQKYQLPWWTFYYIMIILSVLDMFLGTAVFWAESGKEFRRKNSSNGTEGQGRNRESFRNKITWLCAGFLLFYTGTEVSVGGWIITFMTQVRHGGAYESGITSTGFWLGITVGRVVLGFVTPKIGIRIAVTGYLLCAIVLQLVFWLAPSFGVSAVAVAFQGFFMGPLFACAVVAAARLLPRKLHISAIGISSALGGAGAALLPFVIGAIANSKGIQTLQPIILAFFVAQLGFWLLLPQVPANSHED